MYGVVLVIHCDKVDSKFTLHFVSPCATDTGFPSPQVSHLSNGFCSAEEDLGFGSESALSEGKLIIRYFCSSCWELSLGKAVFFLFVRRLLEFVIK